MWDLVIENGTIIDGLGGKEKILNIGISGNKIGIITSKKLMERKK